MKSLLLMALFPVITWAQNHEEIFVEDYGVAPTVAVETYSDYDLTWLYEKIMPEDLRKKFPSETFKSFRVHLKDSYRQYPDPLKLTTQNMKPLKNVKGHILYVGFFPKGYFYETTLDEAGVLVLKVKIYLKRATEQDFQDFTAKTLEAENIWNNGRPELDFDYRFKFEIVKNPAESHFAVNVLNETRGPYDTNWGRDWNGATIAHEIGHMMGLGDEYQTLSSKTYCYKPSLMCSSWSGHPMDHHYYFILRRLFN